MIGQTISHYKILEKLGEGGMGVVYKARDLKLERTVALKFLPHHLTARQPERARFLQEAKAASALNHPNVCVIFDIKEENEKQFIVMEYVDGMMLKEKIKKNNNLLLPLEEIISIALQIAEALEEAHRKEVIHRDIKSENILVTPDGRVKIMDFGLAKLKNNLGLTKAGSTVGTVAYMSPEQIQNIDVDGRTDIWSLGVVLYEMLTGKLPFWGEHEAAIIYSIMNLDSPEISAVRPDVPIKMIQLMRQLLERDRARRPSSCREILQTLRSVAVGGPGSQEVQTKDQRKSIAVLPFANLSPDPDNEFFSDGITEELTSSLSKLKQLRVCSRSMAFQYKGKLIDPRQVGRELLVDVILEGSIRRLGNRVRIAAELTDTTNGFQLWAESYDRQLDDVFAVQDEIARTIIDALELQLSVSEQSVLLKKYTDNIDAYEEYLRGRFMWNKRTREGAEQALRHFQNAIELDTKYALAYAGLAICYSVLCSYAWAEPLSAMEKCEEAVRTAFSLEPNLDEVRVSCGLLAQTKFDFVNAELHYKRAIQLNPNHFTARQWLSYVYSAQGNFSDALREIKLAQKLDPMSLIIDTHIGFIYFCMGDYTRGLEEIQKALEIDGTFAVGLLIKAWILTWLCRYDEAGHDIGEAKKVWGEHNHLLGAKAVMLAHKGDLSGAAEVLKHLREREQSGIYVHPYEYAYIYAALGDKTKAFEMLEKASDVKASWWFTQLKVHPVFASMRNEPQFQSLLKKLNLA